MLSIDGIERDVAVAFCGDGFVFELAGARCPAAGTLAADGALVATLDGLRSTVRVIRTGVRGEQLTLFDRGDAHHIMLVDPGAAPAARPAAGGRLAAPMPGRVVQLHVSAGDTVSKGSVLVVVEAMKMEHAVRAPRDGIVARVDCRVGDLVEEGVALLTLALPEASGS
jgi:3-methylcrotonyl-CoA carboxylase alpha subunit